VSFDLAGFRSAAVSLDAERWLTYFAEDAVWTEYRHFDPPRRPHVMRGLTEIGPFLREVCADDLTIAFDNGLADGQRAAYTLTVTLPGGRRIIENAILDHRDGKVTNLVEVEAWDP
jgi:hypothetical protein